MRIVLFGTYDRRKVPRVPVLGEGLSARGADVYERNIPLGLDSTWRTKLLRRPWLLPLFLGRLFVVWLKLWWAARDTPAPDVVIVGWMGQLDVHLARRIWPRAVIVLDHLTPLTETAVDRRVSAPRLLETLNWLDERALEAADLVCVDTEEHVDLLPERMRERAVIVPVGAEEHWFSPPPDEWHPPLRVIFFGLFTPLQGAPVIAEAVRALEGEAVTLSMVGDGQDLPVARQVAGHGSCVVWRSWMEPDELSRRVREHDVCLGIFGTGPKAGRVVPNKVFQGAAAGAIIVTSDTEPQRRLLGDAALYVPPGDARALANVLRSLLRDSERLPERRFRAYERAVQCFRPAVVVEPLWDELAHRFPTLVAE